MKNFSLNRTVHRNTMVFALAFVAHLLTIRSVAADDRPNFLLILADDVGQECLGCYGGESYPTPHLDHLAETGIRFRHCYSMPMCHPTRLTLMTGRYPIRFRDTGWGQFPKSAEASTFARILAETGYATGIAGKWQLTLLRDDPNHPRRLGFHDSDLFGWHEGPRYYEPMIYRNGKVRDDTLGYYGPDLYVRSLIEFMKRNRNQPFLAYYPMALCHAVTDDLDQPVPHGPLGRYDSYAEMIAEMDRSVGRLVAALDALELRDKTVILFVGDNGTPSHTYLRAEENRLIKVPVVSRQNGRDIRGGKGTLSDGGTRVPLIVNWPGTIRGGQVTDNLVDVSDFWPTLLELAQIARPERTDGVSFAKVFQGDASKRKWAYSQSKTSRWVRTQRYKLYEDGRFFDMQTDPQETQALPPVKDTTEQHDIREMLQSAFSQLAPLP